MRLRTPTAELVARAFADAVAAGEHEAAEGWLAVAAFVEARREGAGAERSRGALRRARSLDVAR